MIQRLKVNRKHLILLLLFMIGIKLAYYAFDLAFDSRNDEKPKGVYGTLIRAFKGADSNWYQIISENGYREIREEKEIGYSNGPEYIQSEWAFFPAYPALITGTSWVLHTDFDTSALIWSVILSVFAIWLYYWLGCCYLFKNADQALFSALVLFLFPFSFYYSMFYTESFFFVCMVLGFLAICHQKYVLLFLVLIPMALVRPNGLILLLPLYLFFLEQKGVLGNGNFRVKSIFQKEQLIPALAFAVAPLAFILYGYYQYRLTGHFFAFSIAQRGWYREFMFPLLAFFRKGDIVTQFNSVFTILVIIYAVLIRKKLPLSMNVLIWISILLPLCSGSVMSMTRFVSVLFPIFAIISTQIYNNAYRSLILIGIVVLHFWSFYAWVVGDPIAF